MLIVSVISMSLSTQIEIGGKHPLEAPVLAIIFGIAISNLGALPSACRAGVKNFEKILIWGIILIGGSFNFNNFASQGTALLGIIFSTMLLGLVSIYVFSRMLKLNETLSVLLAAGTTICGGTAIAVISPLIKAKEEETSYAIGTIALWGLAAILIYPFVGQLLHISDFHFGVFAGTAIHSTPQVVGAGMIFSDQAGETATAVKLVRNCFLAPLAMLIALWYGRKQVAESAGGEASLSWDQAARAFPWFLFGYFVMAGLNTSGYFTPEGVKGFKTAGKFLILLGMAGIGLNTRLGAFKTVGYKPLFVGLIGSAVVAGSSALLIMALL
jgi:uncharacterized integral membrane protein (TIGR00698 family)